MTEILSPDCVKVPLSAADKQGVIAELIDLVCAAGKVSDRQQMLDATLARERTRTTGIGQGLAIPHGKCPAADELVMAIGKPAGPLDFESIDGKPVTIVIYLASPADKTGPHIQALARVTRVMTEPTWREAIERAESAQEVFDLISRFDSELKD